MGSSVVCFAFLTLLWVCPGAGSEKSQVTRCPSDYRTRVQSCIMEAQVAPQSGGGITLVTDKERIAELCDRGLLQKTIDCLQELRSRCSHNETSLSELDRLYSVESWQNGTQLLCSKTDLFQENFDCMARTAHTVATCFVMRTQLFRQDVTSADPNDHQKLREITCDFAGGIIMCLRRPIEGGCPEEVVETLVNTLHSFLPPTCLPDQLIPVTEEASSTVREE